jgi:hypothetical protein
MLRYSKLISFLFLIFFTTSVFADTALILHSNYQDAHTNVKAQLEADGYTVTLSTDGTVPDNLINNYDVVFDLKYNNNIGSNGKDRYDDFVENGGILVITGENHANYSNTNNTVRAFIQNKLGGTLTFQGTTGGGSCGNDCSMTQTNTSAGVSSYSNVGVYAYGAYFTGDGTWAVKSTSGKILWMKWSGSELPNGYTGEVYVTFDINQFTTTYDGADMDDLISDVYSSATTTSASVSITNSQTSVKSTATSRTYNSNTIRVTQSGSSLDLNIVQKGEGNFIEGSDFSSVATLTGDDLTITLEQGSSLGASNNNGIGIDVDGDTNTVLIRQGTMGNSDSGGHKAKVNIDGDTNTLTLYQYNSGGSSSNHFSHIDITGGQNTVTSYQRDNNSKDLFIDLDGSSNTISTNQKDSGNHYLDLDINGNSHSITTTQQGSGNHGARISVTNSGGASTVTLDQNSSSNKTYTLTQDCTNSNGCSTTVTQN